MLERLVTWLLAILLGPSWALNVEFYEQALDGVDVDLIYVEVL